MITVDSAYKAFGDNAVLKGVDLVVEPGEICCIIGLNGAGKSTLLDMIAGLRRPDRGSVRIGEASEDPFETSGRRRLGYAAQDIAFYPTRTARENIAHFANLRGLSTSQAAHRVNELGRRLAIEDLLDSRAGHLSGGQQRRVHLACGIVHEPKVALLDETTTGVDIETRGHVLEVVTALAAAGTSVCYTTHHLEEIAELAATVAILSEGEIVYRGSTQALIDRWSEAYVEIEFSAPCEIVGLAEWPWEVELAGSTLRVYGDQGSGLLGKVLDRLESAERDNLAKAAVVQASLEQVVKRIAVAARKSAV